MTAKPRVLCVDDEEQLLDGLRLSLRKRFDVTTATSGEDGIAAFEAAVERDRGFAAVVSDMRMPNMNGAQFLTSIAERSSETPRILLSGQADLESTIAAINDAKIFRFLTKPCTPELLGDTLDEAMELARLREAETQLLDQTLRGVVGMLTEVLGLVSPTAYSRSMRIGQIVQGLAEAMDFPVGWDLDVAALLSQVGCVVIPDTGEEAADDHRHVGLAADLLANIPRLEGVAEVVGRQMDERPASAHAARGEWTDQDLNVELLRTAVAFDDLITQGAARPEALARLAESSSAPPAFVLAALATVRPASDAMVEAMISLGELAVGMELTGDVVSMKGAKLVGAGTQVTSLLIQRLSAFAGTVGVVEPLSVLAPSTMLRRERLR